MQYMLPRLRGWGESLSRQAGGAVAGGGGIGTRGPGETKIETDRRRIRARMAKLRREIAEHGAPPGTPSGRSAGGTRCRRSCIAGYTNAGKSSLLNRLTGAGVLVENALFATLDPTVRRAQTPDGRDYTLTDTVGFVRHLPHQLVEAFRSTLEEVADADLILHVVDGSDPDPEGQIAAVREVLGRDRRRCTCPSCVVVNKVDAADPDTLTRLRRVRAGRGLRLGPHRPRARRAARRDRGPAARGRRSRWTCSSRTTAATWSPGSTRPARCSPRSTPATARCCAPGCSGDLAGALSAYAVATG